MDLLSSYRNRKAERAAVGLLTPSREESVQMGGLVMAILVDQDTGLARVHRTRNIITDAGDTYYAQLGAEEVATNLFDSMWLGTVNASTPGKTSDSDDITLITSSAKTVKATYPKTNDTGDTDNTGDGVDVVTWTFEWATSDFNDTAITDGMIGVGAHGAAEPALTHFEFTGGSFAKTASDTLKVIVNHTFTGV